MKTFLSALLLLLLPVLARADTIKGSLLEEVDVTATYCTTCVGAVANPPTIKVDLKLIVTPVYSSFVTAPGYGNNTYTGYAWIVDSLTGHVSGSFLKLTGQQPGGREIRGHRVNSWLYPNLDLGLIYTGCDVADVIAVCGAGNIGPGMLMYFDGTNDVLDGIFPITFHAVDPPLTTTTPEPTSLMLLAVGLTGLAWLRLNGRLLPGMRS
jgi:hypothetical protein